MTNTITAQNRTFVLLLTGEGERLEFNEMLTFERAKKEAKKEGNGFKTWLEINHNDELLIVSLDY